MTNESCCNWRRSNFHFTIIREAGKCLSNALTPYFIYFKYAPVYLCDLPSKSMPSYQRPKISLLDISMPYLFLGIFQHCILAPLFLIHTIFRCYITHRFQSHRHHDLYQIPFQSRAFHLKSETMAYIFLFCQVARINNANYRKILTLVSRL